MYLQHVTQISKGISDDGVNGLAPQCFWGTAALVGTAEPFLSAAIGSQYVRSSAGVVAMWVKTVNNGATADWFAVPMSTALVTATELDILDGATVTTAELNILDGVTSTAAELNYLDITTLGTGAASKAVVLDTGDDYTWPAAGILTYGVLKDSAATTLGATAAEINNAADVSARTQELTVSGAVTAGVQTVELNHASVVIAATIANANAHQGLFVVKDTSATGTAAHTLTLTAGTFNGTNNIATFNARDECLVVYFDSTGRGTIVVNVGAVALS